MNPVDILGIKEILLRLGLATLIGCVLGLNRELQGKPAGLRTHALVTLGAALVTICGLHFGNPPYFDPNALSRIAQGILTGIGFVGAGVILHNGDGHVRGLTTAATIWVAAALGISCGVGYWLIAGIGAGLTLLVLVFGGPVEDTLVRWLGHSDPNEPPS